MMKITALFLLFATFCFSQSKNLIRAKHILDPASSLIVEMEKDIGELNHAVVGDNILDIYHKILCVDVHYAKLSVFQDRAKDLVRKIRKEKNYLSSYYFDEMQQSEELELFSKRSFSYAKERVMFACRRIKSLEKKSGKKKEPRPKTRAFPLSKKWLILDSKLLLTSF